MENCESLAEDGLVDVQAVVVDQTEHQARVGGVFAGLLGLLAYLNLQQTQEVGTIPSLGGVQDAHVGAGGVGRPQGLVDSAAGTDWRSHHRHVGVLTVWSPTGSIGRRHQTIPHLERTRDFLILAGADEGENLPAEGNTDSPEDEEVKKYPRV